MRAVDLSSKPVTLPDSHWNDDDEYVTSDGFTISHQFTDVADFIAISLNGDQVVEIDMRDFAEVARMFCWPKQPESSKPALSEVEQAAAKAIEAYNASNGDGGDACDYAMFTLREALRNRGAP